MRGETFVCFLAQLTTNLHLEQVKDSAPENDDPRHHYAQDQVSKVRYVYLGLQARWVTQSRHAHIETGHEAHCLHCTGCDEQLLEAPCRIVPSRTRRDSIDSRWTDNINAERLCPSSDRSGLTLRQPSAIMAIVLILSGLRRRRGRAHCKNRR